MHKNNKKVANYLAELFANGRIDKLDWRYFIPEYLTQEPEIVRVSALNFAKGIHEAFDPNGRDPLEPIDLDKYDRISVE
jgi:hypothetical protein